MPARNTHTRMSLTPPNPKEMVSPQQTPSSALSTSPRARTATTPARYVGLRRCKDISERPGGEKKRERRGQSEQSVEKETWSMFRVDVQVKALASITEYLSTLSHERTAIGRSWRR